MHDRRIVHRDIRPDNMMFGHPGAIRGNVLKLIGFGLAAKGENEEFFKTKCGAAQYVSPQVIMGWYSLEADICSCGVVMHLLLSGVTPFNGQNDEEILSKVFKGEYSLDIPEFS